MKKTGAFALFISFLFISGVVFAAEVTGPLGPDQNTGSGFEGDAEVQGEGYYPNGTACTSNSDCNSGHCAFDYDYDGNWCADVNYCAHDGTVTYASGSKVCYGDYRETCSDGNWATALCSTSCQAGDCVGGTACGDAVCEVGEDCSSCPADCGACPTPTPTPAPTPTPEPPSPGGGPGGGPGRTPTPSPSPSPSPTPTPDEYERETIVEETEEYTPSDEEIGGNLVDAGVTDPEEIEETIDQMGDAEIEKSLEVEKKTHKETGEESYESSVTISVTNTGDDPFVEGVAYELIPKSLISDPSMISSDQPFEVEETEDYIILKWSYDSLAPGETTTFTYTVDFELSDEILKKSNSLFSAERKELPPEKLLGNIVVNILFNGVPVTEEITVFLFKDDVKVWEKKTLTGQVEFFDLEPGSYYAISQPTDRFNSERSAIIELKAQEIRTINLSIMQKPVITPKPLIRVIEEAPLWMWIALIVVIIAILLILYFGRGQLIGLAAGVKNVPRRAGKKAEKETGKKIYECDICGEEFHSKIALGAHKKRVHYE